MLKKKGFLKIFLALVFCFSIFSGNVLLGTKNLQDADAASDFSGLTKTSSGGNWSYSGDTLYLSGVELCGQINLENDLNIVLQNGTTSKIYYEGDSVFAASTSKNLTISGDGTLILELADGMQVFCSSITSECIIKNISFNGLSCEYKKIKDGDVISAEGDSLTGNNLAGVYYRFTTNSSSGGSYSETSSGDPTDEGTSAGDEHTHNFTYASTGAILTATCTAEGCDLTEAVSVTLSVSDIDFRTDPTLTFNLTTFNVKTGLSLSSTDFTKTFYKTEAEGVTTGGTEAGATNLNAGFYYVKLSTTPESAIGEQNLVCAFKVNKISAGTFVGEDKKISFSSGTTYDVSNMFTLPDGMTGTYEIVSDGTTGTGTLEGLTLTFGDAGVYKIKCTTSGSENYLSENLTKTLTITKPLNFTVSLSDWDVDGEPNSPIISLTDKTATFAYFTDEDCTSKTTVTNGATEEGGKPTKAGVYYVKATISADETYDESSAKTSFVIWGTPSITLINSTNEVRFNSLPYTVDNVYKNVNDLFNLDANCGTATYYLVTGEGEDAIEEELSDAKLIVTAVKTYLIRVKTAATNCYKAGQCDCEFIVKKAIFNLSASVTVTGFEYGGTLQVQISERTFGATETCEYFTDAACNEENKLEEVPTIPNTYYVVISLAETDVSEAATITKSFEITKKQITNIIWSGYEYRYNGNVQTVNAYYKDANDNEIALVVTYKDTEGNEVIFKNAGEYEIYVDFATTDEENFFEIAGGVDIHRSYTIAKVNLIYEIKKREKFYKETTSLASLNLIAERTSGNPVDGEDVPFTLSLKDIETVDENLAIGKYEIIGTCNNPNYNITFIGNYLFVKNKIVSINFPSWTYDPTGSVAHEPDVTVYYGKDEGLLQISYSYDGGTTYVSTKPTKPGAYVIKAEVATEYEYYNAYAFQEFVISKIAIKKPAADNTVFTYNGKEQTYSLEESLHYTINGAKQISAGNHIVIVSLNEPEYYKWDIEISDLGNGVDPDLIVSLDYDFFINKRSVEKPKVNEKVFKYNGKYQTYFNFTSEENEIYRLVNINDNSQKEVGTYTLYVELIDKINTIWSDGTTKEIAYEFVINQTNTLSPVAKNSSGEELENSPAAIVETGENGLAPETELFVNVLTSSDTTKIKPYKDLLRVNLPKSFSRYDKIFAVYGISLVNNNNDVKLNEKFILKLEIPTELEDGVFDLYKVYKDENGETKTEKIQYLTYNGSVYLEADGTSEYVFVYEQNSLKALVIIFSVSSGLLLLTLALQIYFLFIKKNKKLQKKNAKKASLAALVAPTFYVHGEVVASIVLGVVMGVLLIANIVLLVLLILKHNKQKKLNLQAVIGEEQKLKNKKAKKIIKKDNLVLSETTEENSIEDNSVTKKDAKN